MSTLKQSSVGYGQNGSNPSVINQTNISADWPISPASILDQLHGSIITTDLQGNITGCNQATLHVYGYTSEELIGKNVEVLHPEGDASALPDTVFSTVLATGQFQGQMPNRTKAGTTIEVYVSITLLCDEDSTPVGMVRVSFDMNHPKLDEPALVPSREDAEGPDSEYRRTVVTQRDVDGTPFIIASTLMHKFMGMVERVASHTETVLITGETGTGKELIARTVHESSYRSSKPFVEVNCAALPEHLVESELFGYEKGAFSGADSCKPGLFEMADTGTVFLDEIGELDAKVQAKLLRVLDGVAYYRLGGSRKVTVNVRVIAATNRNLEQEVQGGKFRRDLYHRLTQFQLQVPPLRERREDISALAEYFLLQHAPAAKFSDEAMQALLHYAWPGNVRELKNVIFKAAMHAKPGTL